MDGWIKLQRAFAEWEWFDDAIMVKLFVYLLLKANFEPRKWHGIEIGRGEIITGRHQLATETRLSEQQIRTALKKLENTGEITIKSTNKFSIITICNYVKYQGCETDNQPTKQPTINQQTTNNQPTNNQQSTTTKEIKNIKNEKNDNNILGEKTKRFIPPTIDEIKFYCQERKNNVDAERFFNFYEMKGWMIGKNKMKDWKAAVRTWEQPKQTKLHIAGNGGESLNRNIEGIWK